VPAGHATDSEFPRWAHGLLSAGAGGAVAYRRASDDWGHGFARVSGNYLSSMARSLPRRRNNNVWPSLSCERVVPPGDSLTPESLVLRELALAHEPLSAQPEGEA
jgi:hypothetical protein